MMVVDVFLGKGDIVEPATWTQEYDTVTLTREGNNLGLCTPFNRQITNLEYKNCIYAREITGRFAFSDAPATLHGIARNGEQQDFALDAVPTETPVLKNAVVVTADNLIIIGDL